MFNFIVITVELFYNQSHFNQISTTYLLHVLSYILFTYHPTDTLFLHPMLGNLITKTGCITNTYKDDSWAWGSDPSRLRASLFWLPRRRLLFYCMFIGCFHSGFLFFFLNMTATQETLLGTDTQAHTYIHTKTTNTLNNILKNASLVVFWRLKLYVFEMPL